MSVLTGIAAPALNDYLQEARLVRARADTRLIGVATVRMASDVASFGRQAGGWAEYGLLTGPGEAPLSTGDASSGWSSQVGVGSLDDHLLTNGAGYAPSLVPGKAGWRGAYLDGPIATDPWGNRYAVNVVSLASTSGIDTVVLSAGPDGIASLPFAADGVQPMGDDVIMLVSSGSR